jgi:dienelactone hydrolase
VAGHRGRSLWGALGGLLLVPILALVLAAPAGARGPEEGWAIAEVLGEAIEVFTYRPEDCIEPSLLLVFHGNARNADGYRDHASAFAERSCFVVFAPHFDRDRFPNWSYHRGGVAVDGEVMPAEDWTTNFVPALADWVRAREGQPGAPVYLFGHSAGGQFLSRVAAYAELDGVGRIVIANPSTYVLPSEEEAAPYGFGALALEEERIRQYLEAPVTIYLGSDDTGDEELTGGAAAERQGENRLERGEFVFEMARALAEARGWRFGWRLVYAEGVDHSARGMLNADEILKALGFFD